MHGYYPKKNNRMSRWLIFLLLSTRCLSASAQQPFVRMYWLHENNTPVSVNDMVLCADQYIWLATDEGLYRFNGKNFTRIPDSSGQPVTAIATVKDGIYAGYKNGTVGILNNGRLVPFYRHIMPLHSAITSLHTPLQGMLLYTTEDDGALLSVHGSRLPLTRAQGLSDNFVYDAAILPGKLLLATDQGINILDILSNTKKISTITTIQGLQDNIVRVLRPIPGSSRCWIGTQEKGLTLYDSNADTICRLSVPHPWSWGQVNDILPETANSAWVATEEGFLLYVLVAGDSLHVQAFAQPGHKLRKIIQDKGGNIWCATNKGLIRHTACYAAWLPLPDSFLTKSSMTVLTSSGNDQLWLAGENTLYRCGITDNKPVQQMAVLPAPVTCLYEDSASGNLWIGTFGKGVFLYQNNMLTGLQHIPRIRDGHILSITGSRNRIWVASLNGVEEIDSRTTAWLRSHDKSSGTGSDYIYQLYPDRQGRIWMATDGAGVSMYDGRQYYTADSTSGMTARVVYSISEDRHGNMLAGTLEHGVLRYDGRRWQVADTIKELEQMHILAVKAAPDEQVIIIHKKGIAGWDPATRQIRNFEELLPPAAAIPDVLNAITIDRAGNIYTPFTQGILQIKKRQHRYDIRPVPKIGMLSLYFKPLQTQRTNFRHQDNHISFHYDAFSYTGSAPNHYRYRLEGYDDNWITTRDETASFTQLPPGKYTFRVQASLHPDFSMALEDSHTFLISTPFWKKAWFLLSASLLAVLLIYSYIRIREQHLRKLSWLQQERLSFEYEHLKSQVNPHFLFNSLNTLTYLIEDNAATAATYTAQLSDLYRNMLLYKDRELIFLYEECRLLDNYMYIQQSRFGTALQLNREIPDDVIKHRKIIPMALQFVVENAIKHNVISRSQPLVINICYADDMLTVSHVLQPKLSTEKSAGVGLQNIARRYQMFTGKNITFGIVHNQYVVTLPLS